MVDLKIINYNYSFKERTLYRLGFIIKVLKDRLLRKRFFESKEPALDRKIEHKEISFNKCIMTCYFTKLKDPIKGFTRNNPDINYIAPWYNSMKKVGCNGIIVHDGLSEDFISKYETDKILFIRYVPGNYSIFEERWMAYYLIISNHSIKWMFITDSNDVTINFNPFERHQNNKKLYVGRDLANRVGDSQWIIDEMNNFIKESKYKVNSIVLHQNLFNAGLLGGSTEMVLPIIKRIINLALLSKSDLHKDMSLLNIAISEIIKPKISLSFYQEKLVDPENDFSKYIKEICSGHPFNSTFQAHEINSNCTFTHK
jgi:hypothetical protein